MQLPDLHTHTTFSDGEVSLESLVQQEQKLGRVLGVSDHLFSCGMFTLENVRAYLHALSQYPVYRGVEVNMEHTLCLPDDIAGQLDYVIASVHNVPDGHGGFIPLGEYFNKRSGNRSTYHQNYGTELDELYLENTYKLIERAFAGQRIDILGHITVMPMYDDLQGTAFAIDWENAVISLCKKYEVSMEISGLWNAPNLGMLQRANEAGVRFSSGSDCHRFSSIGVLEYVEQAIAILHLDSDTFYLPSAAIS